MVFAGTAEIAGTKTFLTYHIYYTEQGVAKLSIPIKTQYKCSKCGAVFYDSNTWSAHVRNKCGIKSSQNNKEPNIGGFNKEHQRQVFYDAQRRRSGKYKGDSRNLEPIRYEPSDIVGFNHAHYWSWNVEYWRLKCLACGQFMTKQIEIDARRWAKKHMYECEQRKEKLSNLTGNTV